MRIKLNKLGKPEYNYIKVVHGIIAEVTLYKDPCYCIKISYGKVAHCYPLTKDQYIGYCFEAINVNNPDKDYICPMVKKYYDMSFETDDKALKTFYMNVATGFGMRLNWSVKKCIDYTRGFIHA